MISWSLPGASRAEALQAGELHAAARHARGVALKVIAYDLGLSPAAASKRIGSAVRELRLRSVAELVSLFSCWPDGVTPRRLVRTGGEGLALTYATVAWPLPACLTPAERRVVQALVEGKSYRAIARERGVSAHTVAGQLAATYRKLEVQSRMGLFVALRRLARTPP